MKRIAVFASGSGTNAENLIQYFRQSDSADIVLVLSDNPRARVLERAAKYSVPTVVFSREELRSGKVLDKLEKNKIDFIVLAGFLGLVPAEITRRYENRIVNIHPALLPSYGGKGMYGMNVHRAVIEARRTGIGHHHPLRKRTVRQRRDYLPGPHRSPRRRHAGGTGRKGSRPRIQILPSGSGRVGQRSLTFPFFFFSCFPDRFWTGETLFYPAKQKNFPGFPTAESTYYIIKPPSTRSKSPVLP